MLFVVREYLLQLELTIRLVLLLISNVFLVVYVRRAVAPVAPGLPRLRRSVPVLFTVLFMSILFDPYLEAEFLLAFQTTVNALWLTLWKVFALCLNRGQLVKALDSGNLPAFVLGLLFPVNVDYFSIPVDKKSETPGIGGAFEDVRFSVIKFNAREFLSEFVKLVVLIMTKILTMLCMEYGTRFFVDFPYARDVCFSFFIYALTSFLQDIFNFVVLLTMQMKLGSNFNSPVLSQSVSEFWSSRYNLVMNATLRNLIYDPICEGRWVASRRYLDRPVMSYTKNSIAVLMTFFASAVVHIFVGMNILRMEFPLLFSLFFLFNGLVICVEKLIKGYIGKTGIERITRARFYPILSRLYVYGVVFSLAHWFFWPDTIECGLAEKMLTGVGAVFGRL